jgi:hypothetical protein
MSKAKLLAILKTNRDEHRDIFLKAQKAYRQRAIEVLDQQLRLAREGKSFVLAEIIQLAAPEDHTGDYDRAIKMLEFSVDKTVVLSAADFSNLVQDQWSWSRQWAFSNSRYVDSPKLRSLMSDES